MGALSPLGIGRRLVRSRLLVLFRTRREVVEQLLPDGVRPRLWRDQGFVGLCYTRLGNLRSRWIPASFAAPYDHLACRIPVEFTGAAAPVAGTWIMGRRTSSWFGARWGGTLHRADYAHAHFQAEASSFGVELRVTGASREELYVRTEAAPSLDGSVFESHREAEAFLAAGRDVRPADVFAPEADDLDLGTGDFAAEPHRILDIRAPLIESRDGLALEGCELDCALYLTNRRIVPLRSPASLRHAVDDRGEAAPALPGALSTYR